MTETADLVIAAPAMVSLRLDRADEHFRRLNNELYLFVEEVRASVVSGFDHDRSQYVFRVTGQPSSAWGLLVGEFAHQLRAVLDNLVWAVVAHRTGGLGTTNTAFLIADTPDRWRNGQHRLAGLLSSDSALIEKRQPYNRGNASLALLHPLSLLAFLINTDKHKLLHPAVGVTAEAPFPLPEDMSVWPFPVHSNNETGSAIAVKMANVTLAEEAQNSVGLSSTSLGRILRCTFTTTSPLTYR